MLFILIMNAIFASAIPLIKCAVSLASPACAVGFRMSIGGIIILFFHRGPIPYPLLKRWWKSLAWAALLNFYGLCMLEGYGLQRVDAIGCAILWALLPLVTGCIRTIRGLEQLALRQWLALVVATVSGVLLAYPSESMLTDFTRTHTGLYTTFGYLYIFGSVCCAAWGYDALQIILKTDMSIPLSHGLMMLSSGIGALLTGFFIETPPYVQNLVPFLGYTMITAILVNGVGLLLQSWLLQRKYSPLALALSSTLTPLIGISYGVFLLKETWTPLYTYATFGTLLSAYLWGSGKRATILGPASLR